MVNTTPTPLNDAMAFAQRFTNLRKQANLTQDALAEAVGVHVSQIRRYEAGTSTPTLDVLKNIALALHTSADTLVFDENERAPSDDLTLIFEAINDLDPTTNNSPKNSSKPSPTEPTPTAGNNPPPAKRLRADRT